MLALLTYLFDLVEIEARELNVVFALRWNTAGISLEGCRVYDVESYCREQYFVENYGDYMLVSLS